MPHLAYQHRHLAGTDDKQLAAVISLLHHLIAVPVVGRLDQMIDLHAAHAALQHVWAWAKLNKSNIYKITGLQMVTISTFNLINQIFTYSCLTSSTSTILHPMIFWALKSFGSVGEMHFDHSWSELASPSSARLGASPTCKTRKDARMAGCKTWILDWLVNLQYISIYCNPQIWKTGNPFAQSFLGRQPPHVTLTCHRFL